MKRYTFVAGASTLVGEFVSRINSLLDEGWACQGGIHYGPEIVDRNGEPSFVLAQALVRREPEKVPAAFEVGRAMANAQ